LLLTATLTASIVAGAVHGTSSPAGAAGPGSPPLSIVQLGDSIASGEGTLYQAPQAEKPSGQLYFCKSASDPSSDCHSYLYGYYNGYWMSWPSTSPGTWTPSGSPGYPECHQSPDAYGQIVAGADNATFTQLACTGASFLAGITAHEAFPQGSTYPSAFLSPYTVGAPTVPSDGTASVPAQFGDIATDGAPSNVNAAYTAAKPNVVLLTLGADDLKFVDVLSACIEWNYVPAAPPVSGGQASAPYGGRYSGDLQCSDDNAIDKKGPTSSAYPDGVIQDYYANQLVALHSHLMSLLSAIENEGRQPGQGGPPKIVITNYPNPLPDNLPKKDGNSWASDFCPDTFPLYNAQIDYFSGLVYQLDTDLAGWVGAYQKTSEFGKNVAFVNLAHLDQGHQWCDDSSGNLSPSTHDLEYRAPYAYGFSVNGTSTSLARYPAPAIFHPTITGQQQIATCVKPAVGLVRGDRLSPEQSRRVRLLAQGKYRIPSTMSGNRILDSC
jgi:hypothetical protein